MLYKARTLFGFPINVSFWDVISSGGILDEQECWYVFLFNPVECTNFPKEVVVVENHDLFPDKVLETDTLFQSEEEIEFPVLPLDIFRSKVTELNDIGFLHIVQHGKIFENMITNKKKASA